MLSAFGELWTQLACGVEPKPNQIVVCKLHSGYTIKRFKLNDARGKRGLFLVPANDDYSPRELLPADEAEIVGTVTSIIKRL